MEAFYSSTLDKILLRNMSISIKSAPENDAEVVRQPKIPKRQRPNTQDQVHLGCNGPYRETCCRPTSDQPCPD